MGGTTGERRWLRSSHWTRFARPQRRLAGVCGADGTATGCGRSGCGWPGRRKLPFDLYIKAESEQPIGQLQAAAGRTTGLRSSQRRKLGRGVITYSSGNHAQGVAYAARALGARAVIVMPENAPAIKARGHACAGRGGGAGGAGKLRAEAKAEELARAHGYTIYSAIRRCGDHCRAGNVRAGDSGAAWCDCGRRCKRWCFGRCRVARRECGRQCGGSVAGVGGGAC